MKSVLRYFFFAAVLALAVCVFALPSFADSEYVLNCSNCNGYSFNATLTPTGHNAYAVSYTMTNVSGTTASPYSWFLALFAPGSEFTSHTGFGGIQWLPTLSKGHSMTFTFDFTCPYCTELALWEFLSAGSCKFNEKVDCYTISVNGGGRSTGVPEPSTWALYGATLLVLGGALWRKSRTRSTSRPPLVACTPMR